MRAAYYERYGPASVLRCGSLPDPVVGRGQLLVEVSASALNPKDVLVRKGKFRWITGSRFPRIPGYDFAGTVVDGGSGLHPGDEVFGMVQAWAGGTAAERLACPVGELAPKPPSLSMVEAAAVPIAALTALQALRELIGLRDGESVLLNGASGGVGTFAIQIAKILGARVAAVCSRRNEPWVRELGADEVLPYDEPEVPSALAPFDAVFDIFGSLPFALVATRMKADARYVTTIPTLGTVLRDLGTRWSSRPRRLVVVKSLRRDLEELADWIEEGRLRPVIDRVLPLEEAEQAHLYLETRRARGKVVLSIESSRD